MSQARNKIVKLSVPADLHTRLEHVLEGRKISIEDTALLYLRSLVTSSDRGRALGLDEIMPLGKFKGSSISHVIRADPDYIRWLLTNSKTFCLNADGLELLKDMESL